MSCMYYCPKCGRITSSPARRCTFCNHKTYRTFDGDDFMYFVSLCDDIKNGVKNIKDYPNCDKIELSIDSLLIGKYLTNNPELSKILSKNFEFDIEMYYRQKADTKKEWQESQKRIDETKLNPTSEPSKPKCPTCGSTNIRPISTSSRLFSTVMLGLASSKIGKSYECLDCKYKW